MRRRSKPLTAAEKALFIVPVLLVAAGVVWSRLPNPTRFIEFGTDPVDREISFSPDSKRLAVMTALGGAIFDIKSAARKELTLPPTTSVISAPSWAPDGKRLVVGSLNDNPAGKGPPKAKIMCWNTDTGFSTHTWDYPVSNMDWAGNVAFSRDGRYVYSLQKELAAIDTRTDEGKVVKRIKSGVGTTEFLQLDPEQKFVAYLSVGSDKVEVHDLTSGATIIGPKAVRGWCSVSNRGVLFPDGSFWDYRTRKIMEGPAHYESGRYCDANDLMAFTERGRYFTVNGVPETLPKHPVMLQVREYRSQKEVWKTQLRNLAEGMTWSPDGRWLAMLLYTPTSEVEGDRLLSLYDSQGNERYTRWLNRCRKIIWSPDSKTLAVVVKRGVELISIDKL